MLFQDRIFNELRFRLMDVIFCPDTLDFEKEYVRKCIDVLDRLQAKEHVTK